MIQFGNKEAASIYIGGKEVQKIEIGGKTAYQKNLDPFVFSNTVIANEGNNQAQLTSYVQINYTGSWDFGYFEVYNELDKDRSVHFGDYDISSGILRVGNLITESNVATLVSPATVTIYNKGTAVWTGSVSFTVDTTVPVECPYIENHENLNECGQLDGTDTLTINCGTAGASILYRYVTEVYDQINDEYGWDEDIEQVPWETYTGPFEVDSFDCGDGDGEGGVYKIQAKAVKTGVRDSRLEETMFTVPPEEPCS